MFHMFLKILGTKSISAAFRRVASRARNEMSGYPQHGTLCQRDPDRGRHGFVGQAEGPETGGGLETRNGKLLFPLNLCYAPLKDCF